MKQKFTKPLLVAGAAGIIGLSSLGAASLASAATTDSTSTSTSGTSLIDKLVAKFGLSKTDVQAVFDEERNEREADQLASLTTKLAGYVTDGSITQAQSDTILARYKENVAKRDADTTDMSTLTNAERQAKMEAERTAFDAWVTSSGIPEQYARLARGFGHGHGGFGGMHGDLSSTDDTTSSSSTSSSTSTTTSPTTTTN